MSHQEKTAPEDTLFPADPPEAEEAFRFLLTAKDVGERLDKVLSGLLPRFSRSRIQQWIEQGFVTVDMQNRPGKYRILGGEEVLVFAQATPEEMAYRPEPVGLDIIFEDSDVLVVNKPAGLVVHPGAGNWSATLLNGLLHHYPPISVVPRAGIVHRLDKNTSGLMVVAKTLPAQTDLVRQLQSRTVLREYLALVWGNALRHQTIRLPVGRNPRDRTRMATASAIDARPAITHYERIARGSLDGMAVSLLLCRLETGRTHQIRVHMESTGFSLVGDPVYGNPALPPVLDRQALHAQKLGLVHPGTRKNHEWMADLPDDFKNLLIRADLIYENSSS